MPDPPSIRIRRSVSKRGGEWLVAVGPPKSKRSRHIEIPFSLMLLLRRLRDSGSECRMGRAGPKYFTRFDRHPAGTFYWLLQAVRQHSGGRRPQENQAARPPAHVAHYCDKMAYPSRSSAGYWGTPASRSPSTSTTISEGNPGLQLKPWTGSLSAHPTTIRSTLEGARNESEPCRAQNLRPAD